MSETQLRRERENWKGRKLMIHQIRKFTFFSLYLSVWGWVERNYHNDDVRWNPVELSELLAWNIVPLPMIDYSTFLEIDLKNSFSLKQFITSYINLQYLHCERALFRTKYEHQYDSVQLRGPPDENAPLPTTSSVSWIHRPVGDRFPGKHMKSIKAHDTKPAEIKFANIMYEWVESEGNELSIFLFFLSYECFPRISQKANRWGASRARV